MNTSVAIVCMVIVLARIADVTLDTVRTVAIVQGRRIFAAVLGFFEAVIYISVVAKVLTNLDHTVYVLAYGIGFAMRTYLGIVIEQYLAFGQQVASFFTRKGIELAEALIESGYRVVQVQGNVQNNDLSILFVEVPRKRARKLIRHAAGIDSSCYCIINDVRTSQRVAPQTPE